MKLITKAQHDQLTANFRSNQQHLTETDHRPVIKLFTPDAQATWLLTELDEAEGLLFGLCDLGVGCPELGYVALAELQSIRGPLGPPIERDRFFQADRALSAYAAEASRAGRIVP